MLKPVLPLSVCAINQRELLTCWKEIAAFFGKGIRTVQRWEKMGMPVHRPCQDRSVIFADPEELKGWHCRELTLPKAENASSYPLASIGPGLALRVAICFASLSPW